MGKHSKNSNDRAFFSYHERKAASYGRLSSAMLGGHNTADGNHQSHGWGTMQRTLDGDAMKEIDACSLSLQACVNPVVTANGILYDKQVIVEYILSRKKVIPPPTPSGRQPLSQAPLPALSSPDPRRASNAARPAAPDDALLATPGARAGAACVGGAGGGGGSRRRERGAGGATGTDRRVRRAAGGTVVRPTSPNPPLPPPRPVRAPSPERGVALLCAQAVRPKFAHWQDRGDRFYDGRRSQVKERHHGTAPRMHGPASKQGPRKRGPPRNKRRAAKATH